MAFLSPDGVLRLPFKTSPPLKNEKRPSAKIGALSIYHYNILLSNDNVLQTYCLFVFKNQQVLQIQYNFYQRTCQMEQGVDNLRKTKSSNNS